MGSLNQGPNEPDKFWKQPGHPMSAKEGKGGRFEVRACVRACVHVILCVCLQRLSCRRPPPI